MNNFVLFCKSYSGDIKRVQRLWASLQRHNRAAIPFYLSVPTAERPLFEDALGRAPGLHLVNDEDIVLSNPRASLEAYSTWDGRLSQQVVKSEFWRYAGCASYLCIDSESEFIRDFEWHDFLDPQGRPYTVMHQAKDFLQMAVNKGLTRVQEDHHRVCAMVRQVFGREGPDYGFGPTPVIWAAAVWRDLDEKYLQPQGMTLWDAVQAKPSELQWYGEALLKLQSIPLLPIEPLFRVYHYNWQWHTLRAQGETVHKLRAQYLGVLCQSSWQYTWDAGAQARRKNWLSRQFRAIRHLLARYR